jgi:hypothetical protein
MFEYSPAWPHGALQPAFSEVFFVVGTNRTHHAGLDIQTSRTMTVVREDGALTLLNTVRLDDDGLAALDRLGQVRHVVRRGRGLRGGARMGGEVSATGRAGQAIPPCSAVT